LASAHGAHKAGTEVKVTGARHDDQGKIILSTAQHGEIPQSKLTPPKELKKESAGKAGFAVEEQLAKNFGCKPAGSTKTAYDFTSHCADNESKQSKKLKGVVKETMPEKEQIKTPFNQDTVKGESKLVNAKMGQSALNWDSKTRQWGFTDKRLGAHYQKAMVKVDKTGKAIPSTDKTTEGKMVPLLQHLNTNHSDGKITNSFSIAAPAGSTRKYFSGSDVNSLHVHNKEKEHGTTFTVGDSNELKGVTTMGHLGNKDLDKLDKANKEKEDLEIAHLENEHAKGEMSEVVYQEKLYQIKLKYAKSETERLNAETAKLKSKDTLKDLQDDAAILAEREKILLKGTLSYLQNARAIEDNAFFGRTGSAFGGRIGFY
jgi:hypothetical protein